MNTNLNETTQSQTMETLPDNNPYIVQENELPLVVSGANIVDKNGKKVTLRCVNWAGAQLEQGHVGGLNVQLLETIPKIIRASHFNCVRLVYSLDAVFNNITVPDPQWSLSANRQLQGMQPWELFRRAVEELTKNQIMVILNNHMSDAGWCCSLTDGNGLWYTDSYPTKMWMDHLGFLTRAFVNNSYVIGFDLRNEIRAAHSVYPKWFSGDTSRDWGSAALKGAIEVNKRNPDMLLIVGGVWFNMFLCDVGKLPIHEFIPNRIVYEAHAYTWYSVQLNIQSIIEVYLGSFISLTVLTWFGVIIYMLFRTYAPKTFKKIARSIRKCPIRRLFRCCRCLREKRKVDPLLRGAIIATIFLPLWGLAAFLVSGCSITQRICSVILLILCGTSGLLSFALWMVLLIQFMILDLPSKLHDAHWRLTISGITPKGSLEELENDDDSTNVSVDEGQSDHDNNEAIVTDLTLNQTHQVQTKIQGMQQEHQGQNLNQEQQQNSNLNLDSKSVALLNESDAVCEQQSQSTEIPSRASHSSKSTHGHMPSQSDSTTVTLKSNATITLPIQQQNNSASTLSVDGPTNACFQNNDSKIHLDKSLSDSESRDSDHSENHNAVMLQQANNVELSSMSETELDSRLSNANNLANTFPAAKRRARVPIFIAFFMTAIVSVLVYAHAHFSNYSYLESEYNENWGFLVKNNIAPVWVGEFGIGNQHGSADPWFKNFLRYISENNLDWSYWPMDGQKNAGQSDSFGLLNYDYMTYKDVLKISMLSPKLNLTTNSTTGETYPPGFGPKDKIGTCQ